MSRPTPTTAPDPWRAPVLVAQIPDTGVHREIEASPREREAMAQLGGVREILAAHASFDVTPRSGGRFQVVGRVQARVGQTCVVTLEPMESAIDEEIDLLFAPEAEARQLADLIEEGQDDEDAELADPPEAIVGGMIDLGRIATDALFLGIDPYPRKEGAVFEPQVEVAAPEDHPFAALKVLQAKPKSTPKSGSRSGSKSGSKNGPKSK